MDRDIARKLLSVEDLPTLPVVMTQLLEAVDDVRSSAQDLTSILEQDLAISARILRLANSAFYGLRYKVDSLRRAVVVIGFDAVRMLALATSVFDALSRKRQFAFAPEEFWLHALGAAKASQLLAKRVKGIESPEGCFTAGLLHDMGKYCLSLALKEEYLPVVEQAASANVSLLSVERERLNITYAEVGMWLASKWRLPSVIADPIGYQHRLAAYSGQYYQEVAIVNLSSDLARAAKYGNAGDYDPINLPSAAMLRLGLDAQQLEGVEKDLVDHFDEARKFFGVLVEA